ncbi:MAG: PepSY-associated TM helix domain-containing protein [Pseudomonadota bacterium]
MKSTQSALERFRWSMGWAHTWLGIAFSTILFVAFWAGSLTVFDREIDAWMMPELRIARPEAVSFDETVIPYLEEAQPDLGSSVFIETPSERRSAIRLVYFSSGELNFVYLHPESGAQLDLTDSQGGRGFFYNLHYMLHVEWMNLGLFAVAVAAVGMLVVITSGLFIHRKLIQDFFTFRPKKSLRRSTLDLHNLMSMIALPSHIFFPFTGVLIMAVTYFPWSVATPYDNDISQYREDVFGYARTASGVEASASLASIDEMLERTVRAIQVSKETDRAIWPDRIYIQNYGDENAVVEVSNTFPTQHVETGDGRVVFDPYTGALLEQIALTAPVKQTSSWLKGAHYIQFDNWLVRWLMFAAGIAGCVMIATGNLFWMRARVRKAQPDSNGVKLVRGMTVGSVTGLLLASVAYFVINRLLPHEAELLGRDRSDLEVWTFFLIWLFSFVHAALREKSAWADQAFAIGFLATFAVILNWVTTGATMLSPEGYLPISIVMMDGFLLAVAALAIWSGFRLHGVAAVPVRSKLADAHEATPINTE